MIDEAAESRRVLSVFRERPHSVDPARTEARRTRSLPRLERHVAEVSGRHRRARRARMLVAALAAAAGLVALGTVVVNIRRIDRPTASAGGGAAIRAVEGQLVHHLSGARRTVSTGDTLVLPVSGELGTDVGSGATLETTEGLLLHLEGSSRLGLSGMSPVTTDRSVELHQGQIQCAVPKLEAGSRFSVVTPNARVVVHGTRFTVRVDSAEAGVTRTCVRVNEGVVAVRHSTGEAMLGAGEEWGCRAEPPAAPSPASTAAPVGARAGAAQRADRAAGTLAEETALLQTALSAERKGQRAAATAALRRLVSRYPDSPLAPEARAVLERVSGEPLRAP